MEITRSLIRKFLENNCTKEEALAVHEYLTGNSHLLDEYMNEEEWENFEVTGTVEPEKAVAWLEAIEQQKEPAPVTHLKTRNRWWQVAAAAAVVGIVALLITRRDTATTGTPVAQADPETDGRLREEKLTNHTDSVVSYTLEDASVVTLYPNSALIRRSSFGTQDREVWLQGEAVFSITKDAQQPFIVQTRDLSTTVLGTVFRVVAYDSLDETRIKLKSGKIQVKGHKKQAVPLYPAPGEVCIFSHSSNDLRLEKPVAPQTVEPTPKPLPLKHAGQVDETDTEVRFFDTPLAEVLSKISTVYKVPVSFDAKQLKGRKFTGSFLKDQSVAEVLDVLAGLNNLKIIQEDTTYRVMHP